MPEDPHQMVICAFLVQVAYPIALPRFLALTIQSSFFHTAE